MQKKTRTPEWRKRSEEQFKRTIEEMNKWEEQPSAEEWNRIAMEKNLLSSKSLQYIWKIPFSRVWRKLQNKKK